MSQLLYIDDIDKFAKELVDTMNRNNMLQHNPIEPSIGVNEAAIFLGISKTIIYKLVRLKRIPHQKVGSSIRFYKHLLATWEGAETKETRINFEDDVKTLPVHKRRQRMAN